LTPLQRARAAVDLDQRAVVGVQVLADAGVDAAGLAAGGLDLRALAAQAVHVGRGAAQVGDGAGEALDLVADVLDLAMIESSERLWMMRPSCSVIEQKVQPPKQPRMMLTRSGSSPRPGSWSRRRGCRCSSA
jgi:hypothetical protein